MSPKQTLACIVARMRDAARNRVREGEDDRLVLKWADELAALPVGDGEPVANMWVVKRGDQVEIDIAALGPAFSLQPGDHDLYLAPPPAAAPAGFVLVPKEPTEEMVVAFAETWFKKRRCIDDPEIADAYAAMIAARPDAPGEKGT